MNAALCRLTGEIEKGLTVWPAGDTARGPTREPYQTFALGYVVGSKFTDDDLIRRMSTEILQYKKLGKFISWRTHLQFVDGVLEIGSAAVKAMKVEAGPSPLLPCEIKARYLRCRVLITPWATEKELADNINRKARPETPGPIGAMG